MGSCAAPSAKGDDKFITTTICNSALFRVLYAPATVGHRNIKKLLYLAGDDAVINYGKMRLEFCRKHWRRIPPVTSAFVCCIRKCLAAGYEKASAGYRDFIIGNRALLDLVNSAGEGAPVAHYSADEIQSLFSAQIQGSVDKYGDSFLTDDPYVLAEDKLQTCQMEIDLMADVLRAPPVNPQN
ncbi:hypothetical protein [Klebsiella pneumoniae]|uniref:hypothetical protein n=1 Tax=Klebsiella pneumoniae TaxID=573 RepID=UPI001E5BADA9|nr:hypothetical protein [Klebsiella pneumoniae]